MPEPLTSGDAGANYMAYRSTNAEQSAGAALLKELSGGKPEAPGGAPMAPSGIPAAASPDKDSELTLSDLITGKRPPKHGLAYRAASDIGRGALEIGSGRAEYTGARDALENAFDAADDFGKWIAQKTGLPEGGAIAEPLRKWVDKNVIEDPKTVTGGLAKNVTQFLTGLALTNRGLSSVGLPTQLAGGAGYTLAAAKGAATNFMAFDPHQQRLSNLIEKIPGLSNPVTQYLAAKPDDSAAEGRLKNAIEGTGLGLAGDGLLKGIRLLRETSAARTASAAPVETAPKAPELGEDAFRQLGDASPEAPLVSDKPLGVETPGTQFKEPPAEAGQPTELGAYLKGQQAERTTAGVTPEEVAGATKPEKPQVYVNFARINAPEDVQAATQQIADRFASNVDAARRGVQTFEEIKLGAQMENAWDVLKSRRVGEPLSAEQSVASRELWASSADKLKQLAQTAVAAPTPENLFAFRKMMATHYAIQNEVLGARAETARALASWRIPVGASEGRLLDVTDRIRDFGGGTDNVRNMAQFVLDRVNADQPYELDQFVQKGVWARTRDAAIQAFTDGLLSAPRTNAKILASNISTALWRVAERKGAEMFGGEVVPGEAGALWQGWVGSFKDGLAYLGKSLRTGTTGEGIGEPHEAYPSYISSQALNLDSASASGRAADFLGAALQWGFGTGGRRLIAAQHDMALTMAYRAELNAQAYRQVYGEAARGERDYGEFGKRMAELLNDPPEALMEIAKDSAKRQAFLNEPGGGMIGATANKLMELRNEVPAVKLVLPFIKIPANIMQYTFERTPLAPLMSEYRANIAAGGARADLARAQAAMGSMLQISAADMVLSGQLKGGGSEIKGVEQAEEREGKLRDSIKIGNTWYNINGIHPLGKLLLMAADVTENVTQGQNELHDASEVGKVLAGSAMAIGRTLLDNSYLQGLSDFFATLHDAKVKGSGVGEMFRMAGSAVPAAVGAAQRALDPYQREVYSMLDELKSRIPGLSRTLPPRRDLWGNPVPSGYGPATNLLSPVAVSPEHRSPIDDEIIRQGWNISMPEAKQAFTVPQGTASVDMRQYPQAYSRLLELSGHDLKAPQFGGVGLKDLLDSIVSGAHPLSAVYQRMSDGASNDQGSKRQFVQSLIDQYRTQAKRQLLDEYPALRQDVYDKASTMQALRTGTLQ